jgi:hypothetical protein
MANVSNATGVFTGIDALYVVPGGFADGFALPSGVSTPTEVPVAEDSGFSYSGGTPSTERYRIHGLSTPWSAKMTPGDAETSLFVPQITKEILELFGFTAADATITFNGKSYTGTKFKESAHEVILGLAAINRTENGVFGIKKSKFLASLIFDDPTSAKPVGISLTGVSASGTDTDAMFIGELDSGSSN